MANQELPTYSQVAEKTGLSHWTLRRYAARGVFETFRDRAGVTRCEPEAAQKAISHFQAHGAPGGRPLNHV